MSDSQAIPSEGMIYCCPDIVGETGVIIMHHGVSNNTKITFRINKNRPQQKGSFETPLPTRAGVKHLTFHEVPKLRLYVVTL